MGYGYSLQQIVSLMDRHMGLPTHIVVGYKPLPSARFLQPEDSFLHKMIEGDDQATIIARPVSASAKDYQVSVNLGNSRANPLSDVQGFYRFLLSHPSAVALSGDDYFSTLDGANYRSMGKAFAQSSFSEFKWVGSQHMISLQENPLNPRQTFSLFVEYNPLAHRRIIPDLLSSLDANQINHTITKSY